MKLLNITLVVLIVMNDACQKSQFSTPARHTRNGKVFYTNQYHSERIKVVKVKSTKNQSAPSNVQIPSSNAENLTASTSNESLILLMDEKRFVVKNESNLSQLNPDGLKLNKSSPDTVRNNIQKKETTDNRFIRQVIKFKDGQVKTVKIISQSQDTLMYRLLTEPNIIRGVLMEHIDTIFQDTTSAQMEEDRKIDRLASTGFVFSLLGAAAFLVPFLGLFFGILGLIIGMISLGKMNRRKGHYKRRGLAIASLIIGSLAIIWGIGYLIYAIPLLFG